MRQLPIVEYEKKQWFFDERLSQIRNITDPYDFQDLNVFEVAYFKELIATKSSKGQDKYTNPQQGGCPWRQHLK